MSAFGGKAGMGRGRSACASLRSMLINGVMPIPPAIITMAGALVVQAHRSRRADDPHGCAGRGLFSGACRRSCAYGSQIVN